MQINNIIFILCTGSEVPAGYVAQAIHGFVEELVVNDDPEYQVQYFEFHNIHVYVHASLPKKYL